MIRTTCWLHIASFLQVLEELHCNRAQYFVSVKLMKMPYTVNSHTEKVKSKLAVLIAYWHGENFWVCFRHKFNNMNNYQFLPYDTPPRDKWWCDVSNVNFNWREYPLKHPSILNHLLTLISVEVSGDVDALTSHNHDSLAFATKQNKSFFTIITRKLFIVNSKTYDSKLTLKPSSTCN